MSKKHKKFKKKFKAEIIAQLKRTEEPFDDTQGKQRNKKTEKQKTEDLRPETEPIQTRPIPSHPFPTPPVPHSPAVPSYPPQIRLPHEALAKGGPTPPSEGPIESTIVVADLKKIALIFGGLVILLLVIYFISLKTPWLNQFSDLLAKGSHIE